MSNANGDPHIFPSQPPSEARQLLRQRLRHGCTRGGPLRVLVVGGSFTMGTALCGASWQQVVLTGAADSSAGASAPEDGKMQCLCACISS